MPSIPVSLPSPTGGWDAKNALGNMPPTNAVILNNWFPRPSDVILRYGHTQFATGFDTDVYAVMAYNGGATQKLFAASNGNIYDITAGGAIGAPVISGQASNQWKHTNVATPAGTFLYIANGVDAPWVFNGTSWQQVTGSSTPVSITGVTTTLLHTPYVAKQRLWFIEKNSLRAWYLPVQSIGGAANSVDLSALCRRGGYIVDMIEWTITGGFGISDYVAFITSEGELLVYGGTDPTNANAWSLEGIWYMGSPVGNKPLCKFGADALLLGKDGMISLSQGKFFADIAPLKSTITDTIQFAISSATSLYSSYYGWQMQNYPLNNMLLLNVPIPNAQQQYVMNTITGAWCNFTGWNANCWEMYKDQIYFGSSNYVGLAWNGLDDAGTNIVGDGLQAFNYFGMQGVYKRYTMMRPILTSSGQPAIAGNVNVDFDTTDPNTTLAFSPNTIPLWDSAVWDRAVWSPGSLVLKNWQGTNGVGYAAAPRLKVACSGMTVTWISTDVVMEKGAVL